VDVRGGFASSFSFYRTHFGAVLSLSLAFYGAVAVLSVLLFVELGAYAFFPVGYLWLASVFWIQAPLSLLIDDVVRRSPLRGARRILEDVVPRLGVVTTAGLVAALGVEAGFVFFVVPGVILMARWALIIPVAVLERAGMLRSFRRSNELVRGHTTRVVREIVLSTIFLVAVLLAATTVQSFVAIAVWEWLSPVVFVAVVAVATPIVPLMRTLSYSELRGATA
jgi:hypothetical protein